MLLVRKMKDRHIPLIEEALKTANVVMLVCLVYLPRKSCQDTTKKQELDGAVTNVHKIFPEVLQAAKELLLDTREYVFLLLLITIEREGTKKAFRDKICDMHQSLDKLADAVVKAKSKGSEKPCSHWDKITDNTDFTLQ